MKEIPIHTCIIQGNSFSPIFSNWIRSKKKSKQQKGNTEWKIETFFRCNYIYLNFGWRRSFFASEGTQPHIPCRGLMKLHIKTATASCHSSSLWILPSSIQLFSSPSEGDTDFLFTKFQSQTSTHSTSHI